jgi:hypothetical protein
MFKQTTILRARMVIAAILASLAAGCSGGSSSLPARSGSSAAVEAQSVLPQRGGAFNASFNGTYTRFGSEYRFRGGGTASFPHVAAESGYEDLHCAPNCYPEGSDTITSDKNRANSIEVSLSGAYRGHFCGTLNWTVSRGTGKFANATGSGTMSSTCGGSVRGTYTNTWSGTINF